MKCAHVLAAIVAGSLMACSSSDQEAAPPAAAVSTSSTSSEGPAPAAGLPSVDLAAALRSVVPDLDRRIGRFKPVSMTFDAGKLSERERQMLDQLIIACRFLEGMYWRQSDPEGLALYIGLTKGLASAGKVDSPRLDSLRHYLLINGSRWDLVDENRPFVGTAPMPPGHALYPAELTRAALDAYVAAHPDKKAEVYDPYTIVHGQGTGDNQVLRGRKYHDEFKPLVDGAAGALRKGASLSDDPAFAKFLQLRADALLTDDYYASDIAWLDLVNPKFDVIFAPYETYLDNLLGVKTSYGAAILVRNEAESQNLAIYQKWLPDLQDALPLAAADRPSVKGHVTPMEVMDAPFRAGDLRHGYQAVADNLPNDPRIHQEKGTKKIFFKNFMDARVTEVILPLAAKVMGAAQAKQASAEGYLAVVVMHEISHGLGPAFARRPSTSSGRPEPVEGHDNKKMDIREAIGPTYSGLEEAKADIVGMLGLNWLIDHGVLSKDRREEYYASYVAGIFRTVRFGTGEAHGRAEMMEFNYLSEQGAIVQEGNRYRADYAKMPAAIARLAQELLEQEATGDRARAEAWFAKYDKMPATLKSALDAAGDVPIDVDPTFSFPDVID